MGQHNMEVVDMEDQQRMVGIQITMAINMETVGGAVMEATMDTAATVTVVATIMAAATIMEEGTVPITEIMANTVMCQSRSLGFTTLRNLLTQFPH